MKVLIVEDEKITRISLAETLRKEGFDAFSAETGEEGIALFHQESPEVVITDLRLPKIGGIEVLSTVLAKAPQCKVIVITAYASVESAVAALKMGAYDYLTKPFAPEKLLSILRNVRQLMDVLDENTTLKSRLRIFEDRTIIGASPAMRQLVQTINRIAQNDYTVLIQGESGTGKEVVARALHDGSPRHDASFVVVSSSGIPESLLESELFGHERGSFTGAIKRHIGYFERAHGGTIFIDDIDDLPPTMQVKLLRVLQQREIVRVGGTENINIDVRIIAATKVDLRKRVEDKSFREDLYYRLNILPIVIPPLRERKEDIPLLIEYFFKKHGAPDKAALLTDAMRSQFIAHDWPGNVRELENHIERMIALSHEDRFEPAFLGLETLNVRSGAAPALRTDFPPYDEYMSQREQEIIGWALNKSSNNVSEAARLLKIPRTTLVSKLPKLFPAMTRLGGDGPKSEIGG
jgi:two-component system response regulator PilR (NtrC family)